MNELFSKLLATENIYVEVKPVETASFNVITRTLTLPEWHGISEHVEMMLQIHEVGHAIWSSNALLERAEALGWPGFHSYLNIVEDARIERLLKMKYPGSKKDFYYGYIDLFQKGFFKIKDVSKIKILGTVDRFNLYFKIGHVIDVEFSDEEKQFIDRGANTYTEDDVFELAKDLYQYSKEKKKQETLDVDDLPEAQEDGNSGEPGDPIDAPPAADPDDGDYEEALTDTILQKSLSGVTKKSESKFNTIDVDMLPAYQWKVQNLSWVEKRATDYNFSSVGYTKMISDLSPVVKYLVKEFELKKSANRHASTKTAKSGQLDVNKLAAYRTSQELFKKNEIHKDEQDHSFLFILDISGSMIDKIQETLIQLFSLIRFAKICGISFDVYAFTSGNCYAKKTDSPRAKIHENDSVSLIHLFSSKMNSSRIDLVQRGLWGGMLNGLMRGTPLGTTVIWSMEYINDFKKKWPLKKLSVIELTDGDGDILSITTPEGNITDSGLKTYKVHSPLNRKTYRLDYPKSEGVLLLYHIRKDLFKDVNFVGFFVTLNTKGLEDHINRKCEREYVNGKIERIQTKESTNYMQLLRENGFVRVPKTGFDKNFLIGSFDEITTSYNKAGHWTQDDVQKQLEQSHRSFLATKLVMREFVNLIA